MEAGSHLYTTGRPTSSSSSTKPHQMPSQCQQWGLIAAWMFCRPIWTGAAQMTTSPSRFLNRARSVSACMISLRKKGRTRHTIAVRGLWASTKQRGNPRSQSVSTTSRLNESRSISFQTTSGCFSKPVRISTRTYL